jgi:hypothetical protein
MMHRVQWLIDRENGRGVRRVRMNDTLHAQAPSMPPCPLTLPHPGARV